MQVDWLKASNEQRAALYQVCKAIVAANPFSWDELFGETLARQAGTNTHLRDNFRRGTISCAHSAVIAAWIAREHSATAQDIAPDLFPSDLSNAWEALTSESAIYGQLKIRLLKQSRGIVQSAAKTPVTAKPIRLGQHFCFDLTTGRSGQVMALQCVKTDWYPLPLDMQSNQLAVHRDAGQHLLPLDDGNRPHPIADYVHDGLHRFVFIIGPKDLIDALTEMLVPGETILPKTLNALAHAINKCSTNLAELHSISQEFLA
ncbi:hypothetical protein [Pseudaestuariivita rosea]|uniref:hypothetical protein n=1 Tax=Pseudaestuariivita rosea TaxID=2763263 RepID=UPI001ABB9E4C|nr:hypothetical protein [Pseudaestuariivita rosea]